MLWKKHGGKVRGSLLFGIGLSAGSFIANATPATNDVPAALAAKQSFVGIPLPKSEESKSWWAPDKVTVAGMQYPVRDGASLTFLLAALGVTYLPSAKRLFFGESSQASSLGSESTAVSESKSESLAIAGVHVNFENQNQQPKQSGLDPYSLPRNAWSRALAVGGRNAFSTVMSDHVGSYLSEAEGLALAFSEEQHAVKYRKSKTDLLGAFCERLESDAREDWFRLACNQHGEVFDQIQTAIKSAYRKLNHQRKLLLTTAKEYESLEYPLTRQEDFEKRFQAIYDTVNEDLSAFVEELMKLDNQCLVQRSADNTFQHFVDEIESATNKGVIA